MNTPPGFPKIPGSETEWCQAIIELARFLRGPEGCPWDRKQTAQDFAGYAREEAGELVDAFADDNAHVEEEWGDTFFTLLAMAAAAESEGRFTLGSALEKAHAKMIRRHGHIFGEHTAETAEDAVAVWNEIKAKEREKKAGD